MGIDHQKIKRLREDLNLSQSAAAKAAGMASQQNWQAVESGERSNVTVKTLEAIAKVLGVKGRDLLK